MAWVAVDKDRTEAIFEKKPTRHDDEELYKNDDSLKIWVDVSINNTVDLPKGSIEKLIGRNLTWEDEPVDLEEIESRGV